MCKRSKPIICCLAHCFLSELISETCFIINGKLAEKNRTWIVKNSNFLFCYYNLNSLFSAWTFSAHSGSLFREYFLLNKKKWHKHLYLDDKNRKSIYLVTSIKYTFSFLGCSSHSNKQYLLAYKYRICMSLHSKTPSEF